MARNLLKAGYTLVIHNRSRAAVDELNKEGAQTVASAQEVASRSDIIITKLPDSPACRPLQGTAPFPPGADQPQAEPFTRTARSEGIVTV